MELKELRQKSADELKAHLLDLHKEQFSLRMQKATGQLTKTHEARACAARSRA
jgi:large subunit ribosomal protein L29